MKVVGIIPARYASSRFPGKPLVAINGKSMIERVYSQAAQAKGLNAIVVATDDERIEQEVRRFGGNVVLTDVHHQSGTDRCHEAIQKFDPQADMVINIQGDEPFIHPQQIELVISCFTNATTQIATLVKKIITTDELFNSNTPKVIVNTNKEAIYFSRQTLPFLRGIEPKEWLQHHTFYKHIGIYAYRTQVLNEVTKLEVSSLEKAESLEQLRWLQNDFKIKVEFTDFESIAIDTPSDLEKIKNL
jgi:3-deoxy-manno-octulosonate cytidylyltransferase (CMP-KDO synthetase)